MRHPYPHAPQAPRAPRSSRSCSRTRSSASSSRWIAGAAFVALAALSGPARAQDSEVTATALFNEGRRLMAEHHYAEACPKLAESQRLAPSGGTLLNLAECYEHTGQTASAWAAWNNAAARANAAGKAAIEKSALAHATALEPKLARLTIALDPGSDVAGLVVQRDGVAVGRGEFGTALPVDPGAHKIEASAPKKKPWSTEVTVAAKQTDARVTVTLGDEASAPEVATGSPPVTDPSASATSTVVVPPDAPASGSSWSGQKTAALVVGGVGVAGLVVGSVFGLQAKSKNDQALQPANCPTSTSCTQAGLQLTDDAKSAATVSTIAFVAGGAAVVGGVVLWLTAPGGSKSARAGVHGVMPVIGSSYQGLAIDGAW